MTCWIQALTQTLCIMSNSTFFATHTDLDASNPSHSNTIPHLHDHPHQTPSPSLTANSFIGTPPPEDQTGPRFSASLWQPKWLQSRILWW